jgi:hypothetical protein
MENHSMEWETYRYFHEILNLLSLRIALDANP